MYTFAGIAFTYLYQITYFAAVMAFAGEWEEAGRHSLLIGVPTIGPDEVNKSNSCWKRLALAGSNARMRNRTATANQENVGIDEGQRKMENAKERERPSRMNWLLAKLKSAEDEMDKVGANYDGTVFTISNSTRILIPIIAGKHS